MLKKKISTTEGLRKSTKTSKHFSKSEINLIKYKISRQNDTFRKHERLLKNPDFVFKNKTKNFMKHLIEALSNKSVLNHYANAKSTVLFEFLNNSRKTPKFLQKKTRS